MRLLQTLFFTALASLGIVAAQAATSATSATAKQPPVPLLWRVSDADSSLYLLGSFHFLMPQDYPLSPDVDAAFADAESLVFEMPPEEISSPTLAIQMTQAALRSDGTTLDSELSPSVAKRLQDWLADNEVVLQKLNLPAEILQRFEPWFVALTVTIVEFEKFGLDRKLGLETHFSEAAQKAEKTTSGLETGAQQIAFFDNMSRQEQTQFLEESLSDSEEGRQAIEKLHGAWRRGDAAMLWNEMAAEMRKESPALYKRINVERNDAWLPQLERRLKESTADDTLVVVGTLHLLGSDGVVEKLRAKGYKVERLCSACKPGKG